MMPRRQDGALLLVVALLLATMAALAFGMNRAAGTQARSVMDDYDGRAAAYLADAGVAAARWRIQVAGCPVDKATDRIAPTRLGRGSFEAQSVGEGSRLNITASGSVAGATPGNDALRRAARPRLETHDFTDTESEEEIDDALDTTIAAGRAAPDMDAQKLTLLSGQSHALLSWSVGDIDKKDKVLSAVLTLTLVPASRGRAGRSIALHRMTTKWDANATWSESRPGVAWTGNDYSAIATTAAVGAGAGTVSWDVTSLVETWTSGAAPNQGVLLRLNEAGQAIDFYNHKASSGQRPQLHIVIAEKC